jgi:lactoylglutathione lyase
MAVLSVMPHLYVADVARAACFYRDLLGGTQTFQHPAEGPAEHVELRLGDTVIALSNRDAVVREGLPAPTAGHPMELTVGCDSADDLVATLRAAGTPVLAEPVTHFSGHRRAYVADPDGNWIALASKEDRG